MNVCLFVNLQNDNIDKAAIKDCVIALGQLVSKNQIKIGCINHSAIVSLLLSSSGYHANLIFDDKPSTKMKYNYGIFLGGDDSLQKDFNEFSKDHPEAKIYPIPTTGGCAKILFKKYLTALSIPRELEYNTQYFTLLQKLLV